MPNVFCNNLTAMNNKVLNLYDWFLIIGVIASNIIYSVLSGNVDIVGLVGDAVIHWRIGEPSGREVVLEIVDGVPHFYENTVGVITNAPGFEWHLTNLSNYVNLYGGNAVAHKMGDFEVKPMRNKKPPFEITNSILEKITEIAELVGHVNATYLTMMTNAV